MSKITLTDAQCEVIRWAALDGLDDDSLEQFTDDELRAFYHEWKVMCTGEDDNEDDIAIDSVFWEIKRRKTRDRLGEERVPASQWIEEHAP